MHLTEGINDQGVFDFLPEYLDDKTPVMLWNSANGITEIYIACELYPKVCILHMYIPIEFRQRTLLNKAKEDFFPQVIKTLKDKYNIQTVTVNCESDNKTLIQIAEDLGFTIQTITIGIKQIGGDSLVQ